MIYLSMQKHPVNPGMAKSKASKDDERDEDTRPQIFVWGDRLSYAEQTLWVLIAILAIANWLLN